MSSKTRLKIAIVGGGPGGLALSIVLGKYCNDVYIDLYEAAPQFTEIGAGISVWKRTWSILQTLGLDKRLGGLAVSLPMDELKPGFVFRKSDQEAPGFYFQKNIGPFGSITLHRADMLKVLTENLPPSDQFEVHFSKRVASYEQNSDGVVLHLADGSTAHADLVVGADGIKSVIRAAMYDGLAKRIDSCDWAMNKEMRRYMEASWSGTFGYRALVETKKVMEMYPNHRAARDTLSWSGKNKHIISYPISQGRLINLIGFVTVLGQEGAPLIGPPVVKGILKQEVLNFYAGWEPEAKVLLECAEEFSRWAIFQVRGLPTYVDGRVALLGDAAHAMTTHLGAGAGQAIEDTFILGRILSDPRVSRFNVNEALNVYDAIRRPFGNDMVERSRAAGLLYEFNELPEDVDESKIDAGDREELAKLGGVIYGKWEIQWTQLPDEEWEKAKRLLDETLKPERQSLLL